METLRKLKHWLSVFHSEDLWEYMTKGSIPSVPKRKYKYPPEREVIIIEHHFDEERD